MPAQLRHRCSLAAGDRVLLVADPATATLVVVASATVDGVLGRLLVSVDGCGESETPPPLAACPVGRAGWTSQQYWHALPDGWEHLDYDEFLDSRRRRMATVVRDGFAQLADGYSAESH